MSTSSALSIVGYGIGSYFGYPQAGAMIGGLIGGRIEQNALHYRGPRLNDLSVQKSEEGAPIPVLFGAVRVAGNVLQCSEKRPRSHTTSAGKGSGPKSTNYTYDVDIAIELCGCTDPITGINTPIVGVRKAWANGNLIYDVSAGATATSLIAGGKVASGVKVYLGTEDQMPDPTLEALTGVGLTPAYRGKAYIVFTNFQLADFGNALPNFTFEVVASGTQVPYRRLVAATIPQQWRTYSAVGLGYPTLYSADGVVRVGGAGGLGGSTYLYDLDGNYLGREIRTGTESQWPVVLYTESAVDWIAIGRLWDGKDLYMRNTYRQIVGSGAQLRTGGAYAVHADATAGLPIGRQLLTACLSADGQYILSITAPAGSTPGSGTGDQWHLCEWDGEKSVLKSQGTIEVPVFEYIFGPGSQTRSYQVGMLERDLVHLWTVATWGTRDVVVYAIGDDDVLRIEHVFMDRLSSPDMSDGSTAPTSSPPSLFADNGVCVSIAGNAINVHTRLPAIEPAPVLLSDVVGRLCQRAGLDIADIDVSALSDTLHGYAIGTQTSARSALDPLRMYSPFDAVEADGTLSFIPRGGQIAATIPWDDLAAHEGGDLPNPLDITIADEAEIVNSVTVVFPDPTADYQTAAQAARRNRTILAGQAWQITATVNDQRAELPICMTPARASRIAEQTLWEAWISRKTAKFAVSIKYASLRPSDVVIIQGADATYRLRILRISEAGLVRQIDAVFEDSALYAAAPASAPSAGVPSQSLSLPGPSRVELMDIPLLRDTDNDPGFYAAVSRYLAGWPGATLFSSSDGGASWAEVQTFAHSATVGSADDVLPAWTGGNVFDEASRVTIRVPPGLELSSITAAAVLGGGNTALLGDELIGFRDAALIGANLYRLSGLLRGRRGTETAMSSHAAGERFVLLDGVAGLARVPSSASEIGSARAYKAVTSGDSLDSANATTFSNTARGLTPLSPVHVAAGRNASGDVLIQWVRRGRLDTEWRDAVDVPIGETTESYEIDIVSDLGAVVHTLKTTVPTAIYTADDCLTDLGSLVTTLHVRIYQMSSVVGRGVPADVTLTLPAFSRVVDPFFAGMLDTSYGARQALLLCRDGNSMTVMVTGRKLVSGVAKACRRYFKSAGATAGNTWSQIGADVTWTIDTLAEWMPTFWLAAQSPSDNWLGFGAMVTAGVREFCYGTPTALPVGRGADFAATDPPLSLSWSSAFGRFVCATASGKLYSTDDGAAWTLAGTLPNVGPIYRTGSGWMQIVGLPTASTPTAANPKIYHTTATDGLTGWTLKLTGTTSTGYPLAAMPNAPSISGSEVYIDVWGREFVGADGATVTRKSVIFRSTDGGQTWSADMATDGEYVGAYPAPFVPASKGPIHQLTSAIFRLSPVVVSTMSANQSLKRYGLSDWRIVSTAGVPAYVGHSLSANSYAMAVVGASDKPVPRYSTDGITWRDPVVTLTP